MNIQKRILLIEDDESMGFLLKDSLEGYNFHVTHLTNGLPALPLLKKQSFDLCLLDVMMPKIDGFSLSSEIRSFNLDIPIIFLTAKSMKEDKIKGFKVGADDYVTKPFSIEELVLRIKAILKRGKITNLTNESINFDAYSLDITNLILHTQQESIQLTQKEADLLSLFVKNPNTLLRREYILKSIWEDDSYFLGRSLDVFISKLRKYFKETSSIKISNIHGTGYKFVILDSSL
ncbi:response regulator transcription factor [Tenacibaculum halocynthiae]|uniref:response regulator transcription factor n=1 Tax=Tenacibaculum halocynthiae TaxID=1254437 RepID=UPI0026190E87|nr:response regulator transcription factor [uncultured Tenacibaculum sp.]